VSAAVGVLRRTFTWIFFDYLLWRPPFFFLPSRRDYTLGTKLKMFPRRFPFLYSLGSDVILLPPLSELSFFFPFRHGFHLGFSGQFAAAAFRSAFFGPRGLQAKFLPPFPPSLNNSSLHRADFLPLKVMGSNMYKAPNFFLGPNYHPDPLPLLFFPRIPRPPLMASVSGFLFGRAPPSPEENRRYLDWPSFRHYEQVDPRSFFSPNLTAAPSDQTRPFLSPPRVRVHQSELTVIS